jgi:hypothetical protein
VEKSEVPVGEAVPHLLPGAGHADAPVQDRAAQGGTVRYMSTAAAVQFRKKLADSIGCFLNTATGPLKRVLKEFLSVYQCCGSGIRNRIFFGSQTHIFDRLMTNF